MDKKNPELEEANLKKKKVEKGPSGSRCQKDQKNMFPKDEGMIIKCKN